MLLRTHQRPDRKGFSGAGRLILSAGLLALALGISGCFGAAHRASSDPPSTDRPDIDSPTDRPIATSLPTYRGSHSCSELIGPGVTARLTREGLVDVSESYSANIATQPDLGPLYDFVKLGGLICAWKFHGNDDIATSYAFSPISAEQAAIEQAELKREGYVADKSASGEVLVLKGQPVRFAFADGFWAYSFDNGGGDFLAQVVATLEAS